MESVKFRAVNMITNIRVTNEQKLSQLGLTSLRKTKKRENMLEFYKMMTDGASTKKIGLGYLNLEEPTKAKNNCIRVLGIGNVIVL